MNRALKFIKRFRTCSAGRQREEFDHVTNVINTLYRKLCRALAERNAAREEIARLLKAVPEDSTKG